jgi:hypothetical protein
VDVGPHAIQKPLLPGVTDRIAGRIDAQHEIEPDCSAPGAQVLHGHMIDPAALKSEELLMRGAGPIGDRAQA